MDKIPAFIEKVKDKSSNIRLMGFGHRVYKNYDPRAKIMQQTAHEVLSELGIKDDPLLDVARELERVALNDKYFVDRKLYPNVDFYSGITLRALGFPTSMFTVLFALARTVGWISQWKEMIEDPSQRIGRPRQLYKGSQKRDYVSITKRAKYSLALVHQHCADLGLGDFLAVNMGLGPVFPHGRPLVGKLDVEVDDVAGQHRFAEAGLVDGHEEHKLAGVGIAQMVQHQGACSLGHGFNQQHPRHDGLAGKMALEEGLIDGDVLDRRALLLAIHINHPVDEKKGIAVRQQLHDAGDVGAHQGFCRCFFSHAAIPIKIRTAFGAVRLTLAPQFQRSRSAFRWRSGTIRFHHTWLS